MMDDADPPAAGAQAAREASDPETPPERLEALARDARLRRLVAGNPSTPPAALEILSMADDAATRAAVARNPNAPLDSLLALAADFPREFLDNPLVPFLLLERPDLPEELAARMALDTAAGLLRCERVPRVFVKAMESSLNPVIRALAKLHVQVAGEPRRPHEARAMRALAAALDGVRPWGAAGPFRLPGLMPGWFLEALGRADHLKDVASCPDTPAAVLERLARSGREGVAARVARNPGAPPDLLDRLTNEDEPALRVAVARNPRVPVFVLNNLAADPEPEVRRAAARHPRTDPTTLETLAQDRSARVRRATARNPHTSPSCLRLLAIDDQAGVRAAVARNPRAGAELLSRLARDFHRDVRRCAARALLALVDIRRLAADHGTPVGRDPASGLPADLVAFLARAADADEMEIVRAVAGHPRTPARLLHQLARDDDPDVRIAVAGHPCLPAALLARLARDPSPEVRLALARNPHAPYSAVERVWERAPLDHLVAILRHPSVTPSRRRQLYARFLERALDDGGREPSLPRLAALASELVSAGAYERGAASRHWIERYAVARNPAAPPETLHTLARDGIIHVRAAARATLAARDAAPIAPITVTPKEPA